MKRGRLASVLGGVIVGILSISVAGQPHVDLSITMAPQPNPVIAGQVVEFVGMVRNVGPDLAERVQFSTPGPYPHVFDFVSVTTDPPVPCDAIVGSGVVCNVGSLAANKSVAFRVALRPNPEFYGRTGGYLDGGGQVRQLGVASFDPAENNVVSFTLRVLPLSAIPALSHVVLVVLASALGVAGVLRVVSLTAA